jgi:signal transduction histidine kinase
VITLDSIAGRLHLSIVDNGVGFDTSNRDNKQGLGLLSMAERAKLIGARFEISSVSRTGTRINVWTGVPTVAVAQREGCTAEDPVRDLGYQH